MGGKDFTNESIFFGRSGADDLHSMQYMSNWEDADGSMTQSVGRTILGPAKAGKWYVILALFCEAHETGVYLLFERVVIIIFLL